MQAGSKDRSSSMVALYINSHVGCGLFCSWHVCQLQKICSDVWDCVESYTIPMFLARRQKITFTSNPKLIISVLILILLLPSFKLLSLVALTRHAALNLACLLEVGQQAWCTILKFTYQEGPTSSSYNPQASGTGTDFPSSQARVLSCRVSIGHSTSKKRHQNFFLRRNRKTTTDKIHTRTTFQWFLNETLHSLFKQLIVSTPNLLQGLCTMSLAKSVPKGLNP
jgi:hypothetical protein